MGVVYEVRHITLDTSFAMKMFTLDGDCGYYVTWAYDGAFVLTDRDNYNIYDPDGEVVFSCSINR